MAGEIIEDQVWPQREYFCAITYNQNKEKNMTTQTFQVVEAKNGQEAAQKAVQLVRTKNKDVNACVITSMSRL